MSPECNVPLASVNDVATTSAPLHGEILPIELMNTIWTSRDGNHDGLTTEPDVEGWVDAAHGPSPQVTAADVTAIRALRDALRRLAAEVTDDQRNGGRSELTLADAVAELNQTSALAPSWSHLYWPAVGAPQRRAESTAAVFAAKLAEIAEHAIELFSGPDRDELRACPAPGCLLYFLRDHSRREWCSAACGNRARVARHYQRHKSSTR
jgi:predicted RNA-binding Zn ribbon-like protein